MKGVRKLHTIDKHSHGLVSTFIAAVVLAILLVGAIIGTEFSQKKLQTVSRAQITNPDNAACAASCQTQSLNGVNFMGGECLGLCVDPRSEVTNTQFTCQGASACCCYLPAATCNSDCVTAGYTSGSCQPGSVVQGGAICSTGGTSVYSAGCNATEACCCIFTGATATPTPPTPAPTDFCTDTDNGQDYYKQGTVNNCVNILGSQNCGTFTDVCTATNLLNEYSCTGTSRYQVTYTCPNGCSNGQCNAVNTLTPNPGALNCSITMAAPPHIGGTAYPMQATVTGAANNFLSYNWQVVQTSNNAVAFGTVTNPTGAIATWTAPTNANLGANGVVRLTVRDSSNATATCQFSVQINLPPPTATSSPIPTPATACGQNCLQTGGGDDGYCSNAATTCSNGGTFNQNFTCIANRSACCCTYISPAPTATTQPTATATVAPPTAAPSPCSLGNTCVYGYICITATPNNLCVTGTPTPTFTGIPTQPPSPTCFNPTPPIWSPGVTRSGDTITVAWNNQMDGLNSKVEVCTNGGGTCQVIFDGTSPAANSIQKTITGISTKDILVQMTTSNKPCGTTSDLASQYLAANAKVGVNVAPTIAYSNGTPAWLIAGAAFIVVLLITVAIVAM